LEFIKNVFLQKLSKNQKIVEKSETTLFKNTGNFSF
jgi:hypothetical protein